MHSTDPNDVYPKWPDGMLRCEVNSPVRRLVFGNDGVFTQTLLPDVLPDMHAQAFVDPTAVERAAIDMRAHVEHRLLYQLIELGIKEQVWPVAPVVRWRVWNAEERRWLNKEWA